MITLLESARWHQAKIQVNRGCFKVIEVIFDSDELSKHQIIAIQRIGQKVISRTTESSVVVQKKLVNTVISSVTKLNINPPTKLLIKKYYATAFPLGTSLTLFVSALLDEAVNKQI